MRARAIRALEERGVSGSEEAVQRRDGKRATARHGAPARAPLAPPPSHARVADFVFFVDLDLTPLGKRIRKRLPE